MVQITTYTEKLFAMLVLADAFFWGKGRSGLAHRSVEVDDEVYIFSGGRVPFVLRRTSQQTEDFELFGECYLDGVMDGQILDRDDTEWSTVDII